MDSFIKRGKKLYKRFHIGKYKSLTKMNNSIQWFSLEKTYGSDVYGPISCEYKIKKKLKLLDLGKIEIRQQITHDLINHFKHIDKAEIKLAIDPDQQYGGGAANQKLHNLIQQVYKNQYDGTFIHESYCNDEDLEGATEVVLWVHKFTSKLKTIKCHKQK
jgi:hypothetical protein